MISIQNVKNRSKEVMSMINIGARRFFSSVEYTEDDSANGFRKSRPQQPLNTHLLVAERIKNRSVLALSGKDSVHFLNNVTTNELSPLLTEASCIYTYFLNARGRIIHDGLVFKADDDDTLFVDCDISSLQPLMTHLIMFRGKTNVDVRSVEQEVGVWSIFDPSEIDRAANASGGSHTVSDQYGTSFLEDLDLEGNILMSRDPRMSPLGHRILAAKEINITKTLKTAGVKIADASNINGTYKTVRYKSGVAEGNSEIGYGRSLPAEINGDYINAVAFSKTNYTGYAPGALKNTVEYRMLPLKFLGDTSGLAVGSAIRDRKGKKRTPVGFLRGVQGSYGLGLMHIPSVSSDIYCKVGNVEAECMRPAWWRRDLKPVTAELLN